jgi:hypothetical protein
MRAGIVGMLVAAGCVSGGPATKTTGTGDTGATAACPQVSPARYQACLETTAPQPDATTSTTTSTTSSFPYYAPVTVQGSGSVTEVGGVLSSIEGSAPIDGFSACTTAHDHQVRLVDGNGDTWTFGWGLDPLDGASTDAIDVGAEVDFYAIWQNSYFFAAGAMLLSDASGPLFLLELEPSLEVEQRGGISVQQEQDSCVVSDDDDGAVAYYQVRFEWDQGSVDLWSGQAASVPLQPRSVTLALCDSYEYLGCADGCSSSWWAEWAER